MLDVVNKPMEGAKKDGLWGFATGRDETQKWSHLQPSERHLLGCSELWGFGMTLVLNRGCGFHAVPLSSVRRSLCRDNLSLAQRANTKGIRANNKKVKSLQISQTCLTLACLTLS